MTTVAPPPDATIRAMLLRRARRTDPIGLVDDVFAAIEATAPLRRALPWWPTLPVAGRAGRQLVMIVVAAALLAALLGTLLVGVGAYRQRHETLGSIGYPGAPNADHVDVLLAVSAEEAWAANAVALWHFTDDAWTRVELPGTLAGAGTNGLAAGPDGTIWAATDRGVATLRDGRWVVVSTVPAFRIAALPDGTVWAGSYGGTGPDGQLTGYQADGSAAGAVTCPIGSYLMATASGGAIYLGQMTWQTAPGLARFDGRTCESVDPLGDGLGYDLVGLAADPHGDLIAELARPVAGTGSTFTYGTVRYDGRRWTVIEREDGSAGQDLGMYAVAPSGEIWRCNSVGGLQVLGEGRWRTVVGGITMRGPMSFAPDGTLWYQASDGIARLRTGGIAP